MSEYKILNNFLLFREMNSDSIGVNYRAGVIENRKASGHVLLADVYPFIAGNPDIWKRVSILMEGIHKSNIPNLYSPKKIIREDNRALLVYPYLNTWTFEEILDESTKRDIPIHFDLTFSIALAIADLIDTGSSIVVSGEKSFHGFLTPDNILVDQDGKIYLKNYGIFPYLGKQDDLFREIVNKYGAWVAPEFLRKERLMQQSDIYHLGYLIFRILTGEYFSCPENESFDSKFANISFTQHLPSSDKEFITHLINFFKRTLNPDPAKRFANIKEFKDYISHYFHIEELSSVTFNLAYFMNSLYLEKVEEESKVLAKELAYEIPEKKPEPPPAPAPQAAPFSHGVDDIMAGLEEKPKSPMKIMVPLILGVIVIIAVISYFYISNKAGQIEEQLARVKQEQELAQQEYQRKLKALEDTKAATQAEETAKNDQIAKLKQEWDDQQKKQQEQIKAIQEQSKLKEKELEQKAKELEDQKQKEKAAFEQKQKEDADRAQKEAEDKRLEEERKKLEEEQNKVTPGQEVAISEVNEKPVKLKGKDPDFPVLVKRKYKANKPVLLRANMRIDENGVVTHVNIIGTYPEEITSVVVKALKKWEYKPAVKNNTKVTVWMPVQLNIDFN